MKTNRKIKFENIIVIDNWDIDFEASQVRLNKILSQQKQEMVEEIKEYWIQKHQDDLRLQEVLALSSLRSDLTKPN